MRLAYALTATDMCMRENDVTLGIPKTSYKLTADALTVSAFFVTHTKTTVIMKLRQLYMRRSEDFKFT